MEREGGSLKIKKILSYQQRGARKRVCSCYITNSLAVLSRMVGGEEDGLRPEAENC